MDQSLRSNPGQLCDTYAALVILRRSGAAHLVLLHSSEVSEISPPGEVSLREIQVTTSPVHNIILNITCNWHHTGLHGLNVIEADKVTSNSDESVRISIMISKTLLDCVDEIDYESDIPGIVNGYHTIPISGEYKSVRFDRTAVDVIQKIIEGPENRVFRDTYRSAKFTELLCLLTSAGEQEGEPRASAVKLNSRDLQALSALKHYLHNPAAGLLSLRQLALRFGLNRNKLAHGFKTIYGSTVMQYRRRVQLLRAFELLQQEDMQICQVADEVGFQHPCNFSTAFKQEFGCSPRELRRSIGSDSAAVSATPEEISACA